MARSINKRVVRILEREQLLDAEELQSVAELAATEKTSIASILIKKGLFEENALLGLMARKMRVTPINLHDYTLDAELVKLLPKEMAKANNIVPVSRIGNVLTVAVSNPFDVVKLDDARITTGCELRLVLTLEESLQRALDRVYNPGEAELRAVMGEMNDDCDLEVRKADLDDIEELDLESIKAGEEDSPVIKFVNLMIYNAVKESASDIHIEPFDKIVRVRFRNDGICRETFRPPKSLLNSIVSRVKIMCSLDIAERRRPQDGQFTVEVQGHKVDIRVAVSSTVHGEMAVLRLLDKTFTLIGLDQLGMNQHTSQEFQRLLRLPYGLIIVCGPTGAG
ncbi:MAG: ATPase, T2SS/T4P/T4SS family, partial [Planctomycetota bacterium]|nr:ATPase, T2SS/T4P/T4SS family [Planctomycetota bacterium]